MNRKRSPGGSGKQEALALLQSGRLVEARELCARLCKRHVNDADAWHMLCVTQARLGSFEAARDACRRTLALRPSSAETHDMLGAILQELGEVDEAVAEHRRALRLNPDYAGAHYNLGNALRRRGGIADAESCFRMTVRLQPGFAMAHNNLGNTLEAQGKTAEAIESYRAAIQVGPRYPDAWMNLGRALLDSGEPEAARPACATAVHLAPGSAQAYRGLGMVCERLGRYDDAVSQYRKAAAIAPENAEARLELAGALQRLGRLDEAKTEFEHALAIVPGNPQAVAGLAHVFERQGELETAHGLIRPLIGAGSDDGYVALVFCRISEQLGREHEALALAERPLGNASLPAALRRELHFAVARIYDRLGQVDNAFAHFRQANDEGLGRFDAGGFADQVNEQREFCTPDRMARLPHAAERSERPVFIVGMPRSGTSLVEQILASHPQVYGAGELQDLPDLAASLPARFAPGRTYAQTLERLRPRDVDELARGYLEHLQRLSPQATRVTDKMPHNFLHLGLIELLFPGARIIHCLRDPLDTCLSCYFQDFGARHPYSAKLAWLGAYYRQYERLMAHWRGVLTLPMFEIRYEDLVADQETWTRRLVEFCALPWDEHCLRFHESRRIVNTASYAQVRRPLYQSSVGRWRHYDPYLHELRETLEDDRTRAAT